MTDVPSPADAPTVLEAQAAAPDDRPALVAGGVVHTHADVRRAARGPRSPAAWQSQRVRCRTGATARS